ncbi:ATP-binding protein [Bacteroidota bacterium]
MNPQVLIPVFCILAFFNIYNNSNGQNLDSLSIEESSSVIESDKAKINHLLTQAQSNLTDSAVSLQYANSALNISRSIQYDSGIINSLNIIARIYSIKGSYDKSYDAFEEIFNKYEYEISASQLSYLHTELGDISYSNKQYKEAWEHYQFAADGYKEANDKFNLAKTIEKIGLVYMVGNDYEKAEQLFNNAASMFLELANHLQIGIQNIHLGDLYVNNEMYREAEVAFEKAILRANIIKNDTMKAEIKFKLGSMYFLWNKYNSSHLNFIEAIRIYERENNTLWVAHTYAENAKIYAAENNYNKTVKSFDNALAYYKKSNRPDLVANIYLEKGKFQIDNKVFSNAYKNLENALQYAYDLELSETELGVYFELQRYYKELNNHKQSFHYLKKYVALKDTIFNRVKEANIARITAKYETEKKDRENEALRAEQELKEQIIEKTEFENLALISGLALFLLITAYLIYLNNQRKKSNQYLANQNMDIRDKQTQILEINQDLEESEAKLQTINDKLTDLNRSLEYKVEERTAELKQSNDEMDTFLYQSSHALRRPIAQVKGLIQLAKMEQDALDIRTVFEKIDDTTKKMELMLRKLVLVSEIDFYMPKKEVVDPNKFTMKIWRQIIKTHGKIEVDLKINIKPDIEFYTDTKLFEIITSNLLENAYLYSSIDNEQTPQICIDIQDSQDDFIVAVKDNGMGIPHSALNHVFNMFYFATEKTKGYGLGLYVSRKSVKKFHGDIEILEHEKGNTVIQFTYPKDYFTREYESVPEEYA